jgi:hypothetical protein
VSVDLVAARSAADDAAERRHAGGWQCIPAQRLDLLFRRFARPRDVVSALPGCPPEAVIPVSANSGQMQSVGSAPTLAVCAMLVASAKVPAKAGTRSRVYSENESTRALAARPHNVAAWLGRTTSNTKSRKYALSRGLVRHKRLSWRHAYVSAPAGASCAKDV